MFRTMITFFCVLLATMSARADVDPELGSQLSAQFLAGETEAIWAQMNAEMQSALGDAAKLNAFSIIDNYRGLFLFVAVTDDNP